MPVYNVLRLSLFINLSGGSVAWFKDDTLSGWNILVDSLVAACIPFALALANWTSSGSSDGVFISRKKAFVNFFLYSFEIDSQTNKKTGFKEWQKKIAHKVWENITLGSSRAS